MIDIIIFTTVGFLWGITNYLLQIYSFDDKYNPDTTLYNKGVYLVTKNYMSISFIILNQTGSVLFYFSLITISKFIYQITIGLSKTVILSNSISFIVGILCEYIIAGLFFSI